MRYDRGEESADMALCKAEAITIRLTDFSETSQVATLYTREFGRLSALAKGSKRQRNNFDGRLDLLCHNDIVFARKAHTTLHILTECKLLDRFRGLRAGVDRLYAALYAAELVREMTPPEESQPQLFDLLLGTLRALGGGEAVQPTLLAFEARLLGLTGYAPMVAACVACGTDRLTRATAAYSVARGGVLCPACRVQDPKSVGVPRSALAALQGMAAGTAAQGAEPALSEGMVAVLRKLMKATFAHHLDHEPKLMRYV
jgi:DNA repair protein RecO (recombination protein O)